MRRAQTRRISLETLGSLLGFPKEWIVTDIVIDRAFNSFKVSVIDSGNTLGEIAQGNEGYDISVYEEDGKMVAKQYKSTSTMD